MVPTAHDDRSSNCGRKGGYLAGVLRDVGR
jgi:hypothetical protein